MIISADAFNQLHKAFVMCASPSKVKEGELLLSSLRENLNYPKLLLDYYASYDGEHALRAAIEFQIWSGGHRVSSRMTELVKQEVIHTYFLTKSVVSVHILKSITNLMGASDISHFISDTLLYVGENQKRGLMLLTSILKKCKARFRNELARVGDMLFPFLFDIFQVVLAFYC
jgi:hypothetical protein